MGQPSSVTPDGSGRSIGSGHVNKNGGSGGAVAPQRLRGGRPPQTPPPPRQRLYRGAGGRLYRFLNGVPTFAAATDVSPCYAVSGGGEESAAGGQVFRLCRVDLSSTGEEEIVAATRVAATRARDHPLHGAAAVEDVTAFDLEFYLNQAAEGGRQSAALAGDDREKGVNGVVGGATRTARLPIVLTAAETTEEDGGGGGTVGNRNSLQQRAKRGLKKVFRVTEREITTWAFYNDIADCSVRVSVLFVSASQLTALGHTRLQRGLEGAKASRAPHLSASRQRNRRNAPGAEGEASTEEDEGPGMLEGWTSTVVERNRRHPQWIAECVVPPLTTCEFVSGRVKGGYRMRCTAVVPGAASPPHQPAPRLPTTASESGDSIAVDSVGPRNSADSEHHSLSAIARYAEEEVEEEEDVFVDEGDLPMAVTKRLRQPSSGNYPPL